MPRADKLIGRQTELTWLRERLRLAGRGTPQVLLVSGDAGIGKTRLAVEVRGEAMRQGFTTVTGRAYDGVILPLLPFREDIFPTISRVLDDGSGVPEALGVALGDGREGVRAEPWADSAPTRLLIDLTELILEAATRRPLFIVLDDLHWADSSTIALLRHLVYRLGGGREFTRLLVLVAARPSNVVEPLRREHDCVTIELSGLDAVESADLARRLGAPRIAPRSIWTQTAGNPLLIEWWVRSSDAADGLITIDTAVDARLQALSPECEAILESAALLVPDVSIDTLERLGHWDALTVTGAVDEAIAAGVLSGDGTSLRFVHPLIREGCLRRIGPLARARTHAEIANVLSAVLHPNQLAVARHLVLAGRAADAERVADIAAQAADKAASLCAWDEAADLYEAVLAVQDRRPSPAGPGERAGWHLAAGKCRLYGLGSDGDREHFDAAADLAEQSGDIVTETRARTESLFCRIAAGAIAPIELDEVRSLADTVGIDDPALAADVLNDISQAEWSLGHINAARATIARSLAIAEPRGLNAAVAKAYVSRAITDWLTVDLGGALESLHRAETHARLTGDPTRFIGPAYRLPLTLLWLGRFADAKRAEAEATEVSEEVRSVYEFGLVCAARVTQALLRGDLGLAEENADRALRIQSLSGYRFAAGLFLPAIAYARLEDGDPDGANEALDAWEETAGEPASVFISLLRTLVSVRSGGSGRTAAASLPRLPSTPLLGAQDWAILTIEVASSIGASDPAGPAVPAVALLEATAARGMVVSSSLPVLLARVLGDGHALIGNSGEAHRWYANAIEIADKGDAPAEAARARLGLARIARERDRGNVFTTMPDEAHSLAEPVTETTTVLFVDVVDSTRLTEELGDFEYRERARGLEQRLRLVIAENGGSALPGINLGDGLIALFPSPRAAIDAASAAVCAGRRGALRLHIGVHHGSVLRERGAAYGSAVNIAARICALSAPDEILVSELVYELMSAERSPELAFVDRGRLRLKGVTAAQQLYAALPMS